jgi:hypothetical protein
MKYNKLGILTVAVLGICQFASADAFLIDSYDNADPASYTAWVNAGVTEDISDAAGGSLYRGTVYNITGMTASHTGYSGDFNGGVPGNDMLNDYSYVNNSTASVSIGGLDTGVTTTGAYAGLGGNSFTLQADQEYKLYLFGVGDTTGQDTVFTFDGVSKTTAGDLAGAEDSHYVTYEFTTGADVTGYTLDFTYSNNTSAYAGWNGLALVAIPEPATMGLIGCFGGGLLFIRRRFMM